MKAIKCDRCGRFETEANSLHLGRFDYCRLCVESLNEWHKAGEHAAQQPACMADKYVAPKPFGERIDWRNQGEKLVNPERKP